MGCSLGVVLTGVVPWVDGHGGRERLRGLGGRGGVGAVRRGMGTRLPLEKQTIASLVAAAGIVWLLIVDRTHGAAEEAPTRRRLYEGDWLDGGVVPMGFIAGIVMSLDTSARGSGLVMAGAAAVLLIA